jgi:tRNA A37 methylthiotransferase MiaB
MSPEEKAFLLKMDVVQKLQEQLVASIAQQKQTHEYNTAWNRKDRLRRSLKKKELSYLESLEEAEEREFFEGKIGTGSAMIFKCEQALKEAGRVLGYNARFKVEVYEEDKLRIIPKNGSAQRMMLRYEELFMERELSDE